MDNDLYSQVVQGSKWWKFDFHVHTPASGDYGHDDHSIRDRTRTTDILRAAMDKQLDCIAICDHNSGNWIDQLKSEYGKYQESAQRPDWFRPLTIFPGVEISVSGGACERIHLLAIFDPQTQGDTITALLGTCGINRNFGDEKQTTTTASMVDTIKHIYECGGIAIPAHIDAEKGYLNQVASLPDSGRAFSGENRIYAAEFANINAFDSAANNELKKTVEALSKVGGSDAHTPEEIGRFFSWIKMGSPTISSLKLALQSPEWSVKNQEGNPNQEPNLVLQEITITNMKHCGRIADSPCRVFFNPHQTSLIGGRGSGKSTVVESLRIALAQEKVMDASSSKVQRRIDSFLEQASRRGGVMLASTKIELVLRRNDESYKLSWTAGERLHKILKRQGRDWIEDQGNPRERFPVIILSQKQIEELADNPLGLLGIIDKRIGKREWNEKWQQANTEFQQLRERERDLQRKLQEEPMFRAQLDDVESDLAQFEKRGDGDVLKRYQRRKLQWNAIGEDNVFESLSAEIRAIAGKFCLSDFPSHLFEESDSFLSEQKALHDGISTEFERVRAQLETIASQVDAMKTSWKCRIAESSWYQDVDLVTRKYNALVDEYARKNSRLDMSVYNEWVTKRNSLLSRLKQVESARAELRIVQEQTVQVYKRFVELRSELLTMRRKFIESAIGGNQYVKMAVVPFGDVGDIENSYRELLALEPGKYQDAVLSPDKAQGILSGLAQWAENSDDNGKNLPALIEKLKGDTVAIVNGQKPTDAWLARKLKAEYEARPQSFDNLFAWFPEDSLCIQYAKNGTSGKFADLKQGSAGQKAAALLAFLLSHGDEPIVIDQPEDDLDNALVYDLVVKQLHESKNRRQVIVATHNPNIVVNGDSELLHVFHFQNGQVQIAHSGGLDDKNIREDICTIMEGGKEAFERRYKRMELDHV